MDLACLRGWILGGWNWESSKEYCNIFEVFRNGPYFDLGKLCEQTVYTYTRCCNVFHICVGLSTTLCQGFLWVFSTMRANRQSWGDAAYAVIGKGSKLNCWQMWDMDVAWSQGARTESEFYVYTSFDSFNLYMLFQFYLIWFACYPPKLCGHETSETIFLCHCVHSPCIQSNTSPGAICIDLLGSSPVQ